LKYGLETVPELHKPVIYDDWGANLLNWDFVEYFGEEKDDKRALDELVKSFHDQPSLVDSTHIQEGVCVRAEMPNGETVIMKDKGLIFKILEGIVKDDPDQVDIEEIESLTEEEEENGN
jgi:hypothetical protein